MSIIIKGDGTRETFDVQKLETSLARSGAPREVVARTAARVSQKIKDGMTTGEIYRSAFLELKKEERTLAARYSMRRAILEMGPTGFPFEDYFCELMRARGYDAQVRQIIPGRCTSHEVDVVLRKGNETIGAELKFHNVPGFKTDLKTALYVRARFWDIEYGAKDRGVPSPTSSAWLVTNTKFTSHAIEYATCAGITLMGWNYPQDQNLATLVEETGLYPITVLTSISKKEESQLLANQVTLCRDISSNPEVLVRAGIPRRKHQDIVKESVQLCGA
ncbi:MAG: ATP cone domain-containing protein [Patescibacteria group bacterium]